jgi:hypothetical protein
LSWDWTLLLVLDAALLSGAALVLVALVLRDLRAGAEGEEKGEDPPSSRRRAS